MISTLVDIKSEIINSSPSSSSSQGHQPLHFTPTMGHPQHHQIIHQNSNLSTDSRATVSRANSSSTRTASKPQACKVCGKVLSSPSSYYVHMKLHSGSKPFQCKLTRKLYCWCWQMFTSENFFDFFRYSLWSRVLSQAISRSSHENAYG